MQLIIKYVDVLQWMPYRKLKSVGF